MRSKNAEDIKNYSTIDHKAYVFYKDNSELVTRKLVNHYVEYGKIMRCFYEILEEHIADNKSGVYIDGLGYFGIARYLNPKDKFTYFTMHAKSILAKHQPYYISYIPISKFDIDKLYTMDLSFTKRLKKRLSSRIKEGFDYMFSPSAFYYKIRTQEK